MKQYIVVKTIETSYLSSTYVERTFETISDAVVFADLMGKSESRDYVKYHVAKILEEDTK